MTDWLLHQSQILLQICYLFSFIVYDVTLIMFLFTEYRLILKSKRTCGGRPAFLLEIMMNMEELLLHNSLIMMEKKLQMSVKIFTFSINCKTIPVLRNILYVVGYH